MDEPPNPVIASIRSAGRSRMRLIVLDDGREFVFCDEACERAGAREGMAATEALFAALDGWEQRVNGHEAALRLLSHRARSENEMRTRLGMRGVAPAIIEEEIEYGCGTQACSTTSSSRGHGWKTASDSPLADGECCATSSWGAVSSPSRSMPSRATSMTPTRR